VTGRACPAERGFTLIEIVMAVAIVVATVAAGVGLSLSSRSLAVATAAAEFDHLLDSTRTIARETNGATIVFAPDAYGDGTEARVLTAGPNGTLLPTTMPIVHTRASVTEVAALGSAPFAFVLHATGRLGGRPGFRLGDTTTTAETPCPASGSFHFTIAAAGASVDRFVPCRIDLAATAPVTLIAWPAASVAPLPTPCAACTSATLPQVPTSSPTCPPGYAPMPGGCAPPGATPVYHVTASASAPAMTVGGVDLVTAQSTLTNPLAVPAGTPGSTPVIAQPADGTCSVSPGGSQPSGTAFSIAALTAGTCTVTVRADVSGIAGATADTATVMIAVAAAPAATPTPQTCDLVQNGKCYHLIVPQTNQVFTKLVSPAQACDASQPPNCQYVDQVSNIALLPGFSVQAPTAPVDPEHALLFEISRVTSISVGCLPYSALSTQPGLDMVEWPSMGSGSPVNAPDGYGEPNVFVIDNYVVTNSQSLVARYPWNRATTAEAFYNAVVTGLVSSTESFEYFGGAATAVQWTPDFPGCDAFGDSNAGNEYGIVTAGLLFSVYQASP
jgi:prepilin-type N-terminal cleavage/methylation domain-containing protein